MATESATESLSWDKGINRRKAGLLLEDGETYTCSGFGFQHDGILEARGAKTIGEVIDATTTSRINGIHRFDTNVYASSKALCPGDQVYFNYIYHRTTTGTHSNIDLMTGNTRPRFVDYENFTFVVDGESKRAYVGEKDYEWGVYNPEHAPGLALGVAGNPDGEYSCYYTYYIKFPNDKYVETGPSPVATITTTTDKIEWSGIKPCQYVGEELVIWKRLYRTVSGIAYLVTTLDNSVETYTDDVTDAILQTNTVLATSGFTTPPTGPEDVANYIQRMFLIKDNKLYWSEPYMPFSFVDTSDVAVSKEQEELIGIINWGDQLYMVSSERWYRLQGSDPDTWAIRQTFTDVGIVNRHTIKKSKYGIIGLWNDGVYLFDGSMNRNITDKKLGRKFFTDLSDLSVCFAEFDGTQYFFYYASSGSTIDSCIVLDFTYYPGTGEIRIYQDDFIAHAHEVYKVDNTTYVAKSGYEYTSGGTETIVTSALSGEKAFGGVLKRKCLNYLYYDIDTSSKDVTVTILADRVTADTLTLNTSSRERKRSRQLKAMEGYSFSIQIDCADSQNIAIYSPWALEAIPVGD